MALVTLLDIAKYNAGPIADIFDENLSAHPELDASARTIPGTTFKSVVRTARPAVGFRDINEGITALTATHEVRSASTYVVDCSVELDQQLAQAANEPLEELIAQEIAAKVEQGMINLASQFYYGIASTVGVSSGAAQPTKGYPGLVDLYDSTNMALSAGGSSGSYTSVWAVKFGGNRGVEWLVGNDGMFNITETTAQRLTDTNSRPFDGWRKSMTFWVGLRCLDPRNTVARLRLIDTSATLTDALLDQLVELFPAGMRPDALFMTRRSLRQLKSSRTATTTTGAPAPWPVSIQGLTGDLIPIRVTDAISQVETS